MAHRMVEPSWWGERDAAEERWALIEAFRVEDLEAATAELRERCEQLERTRSSGGVVTVGEVADVLLGQWSVAFHAMLADSQRAFFFVADPDRLERAAEDGRAAAVAVRDRYLAPERISGHSLQQALNLANADATGLQPDRGSVAVLEDRPARLSEAARSALTAYRVVREWRRLLVEGGDVGNVALGLLAVDRANDLIRRLPKAERAAVLARIAADERAREAANVRQDSRRQVNGRGMSM